MARIACLASLLIALTCGCASNWRKVETAEQIYFLVSEFAEAMRKGEVRNSASLMSAVEEALRQYAPEIAAATIAFLLKHGDTFQDKPDVAASLYGRFVACLGFTVDKSVGAWLKECQTSRDPLRMTSLYKKALLSLEQAFSPRHGRVGNHDIESLLAEIDRQDVDVPGGCDASPIVTIGGYYVCGLPRTGQIHPLIRMGGAALIPLIRRIVAKTLPVREVLICNAIVGRRGPLEDYIAIDSRGFRIGQHIPPWVLFQEKMFWSRFGATLSVLLEDGLAGFSR